MFGRRFFEFALTMTWLGCSSDPASQNGGSSGTGGAATSTGGAASGGSTAAGGSGGLAGGSGGSGQSGAGGTDVGSGGSSGGSAGGSGGSGGGDGNRWILDNTTSIHGLVPELQGAPVVTDGEQGPALCFDGDDGIILDANPLEGLDAFTLEVLFMPQAVSAAEAALAQPRFVHIETDLGERATIEARVNDSEFYLDTYLLSGAESLTLIDDTKVHPVGAWYWAALTYSNGQMRHFVEGVEDASGSVTIAPQGPGRISIGVRQNLMYWFKGCVRELRVSPEALPPESLQHVGP